jgi:hypothetical protein
MGKNRQLVSLPAPTGGCKAEPAVQREILEELRGLRKDYSVSYARLLRTATDVASGRGMMPIKSHFLILGGSLVLLLGIEVVKELFLRAK